MKNATQYEAISITEAREIQISLKDKIELTPINRQINTIAGADISLNRFSEIIYAGIVLLRYSDLQPLSYSLVRDATSFPYVPGFLAFREVPALVKALAMMPIQPDVIMVDGHGIAHPRQMGIATHLGVLTGIPTLGCAKKILFGKFNEPALQKKSYTLIRDKDRVIGYALRTKDKVKPVFISPGNKMSMEDSLNIAWQSNGNYRIPEPTRRAHEFVNLFRTGQLEAGYHTINTPQLF